MKERRSTALAYLGLLANGIVFFHKPLFDSAYLFPWDFRGVQLPLLTFLAGQLRQHQFALWNPYDYCGYPIFAYIDACFFHPLILLAAFLGSFLAPERLPMLIEWAVVLQLWIAGIAAWHLLREFGLSPAAAWAGAIILETGGYFASRIEHIDAVMAAVWLPLVWLAILKLRHRLRPAWLAGLSAALGMSILGGFPEAAFAVFLSAVVFSLALVAARMARARLVLLTACASALGVALSAAQFIPTTQLVHYSVARYRAGWLGAGGGLYWQSLVSLLLPNHYGIFDLKTFHGPGDPSFLYLYVSIAGLLLALYALAARRDRITAVLAALTIFGMLFMLGQHTPVWRAIYPRLPVTIRIGIHPEYAYCIFTLGLAALAAAGLDKLRIPERARIAIGLAIAADLFFVGSGRPMNLASVKAEPGVTATTFEGSRYLLSAVRQRVNQNNPPWRVDNTAGVSLDWALNAPVTRIPTASGVHPLAIENIIQLRLLLHDGFPWGWYYPVEKLDSPVLDLMNVKYLLVAPQNESRVAALPRFRHVATLPGTELFENLTVMPRFFLVRDLRPVGSLEEARSLVGNGQIDFRRTAITDRAIALPPPAAAGMRDAVKTVSYEPASLEIAVEAAQPALLVLSETWYPGWKAWLDGAETPIYKVDLAFRGVAIPAGSHRVRMEFHPPILPVSLAITLLTAAALIAMAGARRKRAAGPGSEKHRAPAEV
ncbi:MAG TPA: YfhO family protein [Bryobacteraceae bacterium]|nr:YfhO family protein [Bryobacteraceae bacterium]